MESLSGILGGSGSMSTYGLQEASLGLLLAFILGQLAAWLYIYTHEGLSYA